MGLDVNKKVLYIIISSMITIGLLYLIDQILTLNYITKIGVKLFLFALIPTIYILKTKQNILKESIRNRARENNKFSTILGLTVFILIIIAYVITKQYIDLDVLIGEFECKYEIDRSNIIYYGLYLAFINSLLEEFFFRGFIFLNLKKLNLRRSAYFISSAAFTIYHMANIQNWFSIGLFLFVIIGLFAGGVIFNYLDDKQNTFFNSWFVHICADLAIVLVGFKIFGVL
ncbi:MAG: CPBP family intramembrane glutamic endopeptidase [Vulcanibacillus sp.]